MKGYVLDLTKKSFERRLGDITVIGTWVGDDIETEPCLVLIPTHRRVEPGKRNKPVVIGLSAAYKYYHGDDYRDGPSYLLDRAIEFNRALGFDDTATNVHRIASAIYDSLGDLISMPPKPVEKATVGAIATITESSGRKHYAEILDYE